MYVEELLKLLYKTLICRYNLNQAPPNQSLGVFTSVITICSLGALTVTVQAKVRRVPRNLVFDWLICTSCSFLEAGCTSGLLTTLLNSPTSLHVQLFFPRPMRSRLLYSAPRHRSPHILLRAPDLCQGTCRSTRMGMVHMGWAFSIFPVYWSWLTYIHSVCKFPRWHQNWTAKNFAGCLPSPVGPSIQQASVMLTRLLDYSTSS